MSQLARGRISCAWTPCDLLQVHEQRVFCYSIICRASCCFACLYFPKVGHSQSVKVVCNLKQGQWRLNPTKKQSIKHASFAFAIDEIEFWTFLDIMYKFTCFLSLPIPKAPGVNVVCSLTEASELAKKGELKSGQQLLKEVGNLQIPKISKNIYKMLDFRKTSVQVNSIPITLV